MAALRPPRLEGSIRLPDRRRLGYAEYGPSRGRPVLWFHGTPGARRQIPPAAREAAYARDVRLVSVERPGIGASTPHAYDSFRAWADDIRILADALDLERFAVVGLSGGGPYALATAHELGSRVVAAAILGGVAPAVGPEAAPGGIVGLTRYVGPMLARSRGPLGAGMQGLVQALAPVADTVTDLFLRLLPAGDRRVFADPATREMFQDDLLQGSRGGMQAMFLDAALMGRPWGFALRDVRVPVRLWFGDADNVVPLEHGEHLAKHLQGSVLRVRPDGGHLGGLGATDEIFDEILGLWPAEPAGRRGVQA